MLLGLKVRIAQCLHCCAEAFVQDVGSVDCNKNLKEGAAAAAAIVAHSMHTSRHTQ